jgi:TRAP-type C4-dicarboxylate transport system permease small subunit
MIQVGGNDLDRLAKITEPAIRLLNRVGGLALVVMTLLITADVIGRRMLRHPVVGTYDLVGLLNGVLVAFAMAYTYAVKGHVAVELLTQWLPRRVQGVLSALVSLMSLFFFAILIWQIVAYGTGVLHSGEASMTVGIPLFPFAYGIAFGLVPLCVLILIDFIKSIAKVIAK